MIKKIKFNRKFANTKQRLEKEQLIERKKNSLRWKFFNSSKIKNKCCWKKIKIETSKISISRVQGFSYFFLAEASSFYIWNENEVVARLRQHGKIRPAREDTSTKTHSRVPERSHGEGGSQKAGRARGHEIHWNGHLHRQIYGKCLDFVGIFRCRFKTPIPPCNAMVLSFFFPVKSGEGEWISLPRKSFRNKESFYVAENSWLTERNAIRYIQYYVIDFINLFVDHKQTLQQLTKLDVGVRSRSKGRYARGNK